MLLNLNGMKINKKTLIISSIIIFIVIIGVFLYNNISEKMDAANMTPEEFHEKYRD